MITVCGPEGSGTRVLKVNVERLVGDAEPVRHLSLPLGDWWWPPIEAMQGRTIIIVRRPDVQAKSSFGQQSAPSVKVASEEWPRAIQTLSMIPDAYWVCYEAFTYSPKNQLAGIMHWLGYPIDWDRLIEDQWWPVRDENAKYGVPT